MTESAQFTVEQPHFSGSLGELAHALRTRAVTPAQVDLYQLVRAYLTYFESYVERDIELATEALPRLAQVIELKLRLLLPRPPADEEGEDEAVMLEEALAAVELLEELEEAILFLRRRREERRYLVPARAPRPDFPRRERPQRVAPEKLAILAGRYRLGGYFELAIDRLTVASAARALLAGLKRLGSRALTTLLGTREWPTVTVGLAALLELVREGRLSATQAEAFGEIVVHRAQNKTRVANSSEAMSSDGTATEPAENSNYDASGWDADEADSYEEAPAA